ncbi:hypothetical protein Ciccas_010727 [Cichlidogyrus casuarinus]|uniref:GPI ethanolamine phosphate transferase 2 C-terminal domain-containing protein n=1 Tax=Cichlidogyrus casuarinus TaxID=1844966 RepID=A0ABD2PXZ4_9PLAT
MDKWPVFQQLARENKLFCEYSRIQAPSVTLPRIKAITSGRVPQFMDVLSNFGDNAMQSDTWLSILNQKGWKLRFFGDETWLRLFPKLFAQSDPVSSLFVTDFIEVDRNVTRHLKDTFPIRSSKEVVILHYLGLDHIGHVEGPRSESIPDKLTEMNSAITQVVNSLGSSSDWLLIVTGDHGMANEGGHGGASHEELITPLLYASPLFALGNGSSVLRPSCRPDAREMGSQQDISSVIALATGLNPLFGSLGLVYPSLAASFFKQNPEEIAKFYRAELIRFMQKLDCDESGKCENEIEMPETTMTKLLLAREHLKHDMERHCHKDDSFNLCESSRLADLLKHSKETFEALRIAQEHFIRHSTEVFLPQMLIFSALMWFVNCYVWLRFLKYVFLKMEQTLPTIKEQQWSSSPWVKGLLKFSLLIILGHAFILLSSSFVEEEHQFWYSCSTALTLLTMMPLLVWHYRHKFISKRLFLGDLFYGTLLMATDRFLRLLHNTGDKWRHLEDLSDWFYQ